MHRSAEKVLRRAFFANLGAIIILSGLETGFARAQGLAAEAANTGQQRLTAVNPEPQKVVPIGEHQKAAAPGQEPQKAGAEAMPSFSKTAKKPKGQYYVDFRARTAASYGHAFVWYGRTDQREVEVAGLHPASDHPIPYLVGHLLPVPSETGASYGDLDEQYLTLRPDQQMQEHEPDARTIAGTQDSSPSEPSQGLASIKVHRGPMKRAAARRLNRR